jgi:FtsP/CotA-like multicopper oxidase with cupredoxin domain
MRLDVTCRATTPGKPKSLFDGLNSDVKLNPDVKRLVHPKGTSAADEPPALTLGDHEHRVILLGEQPTGMLYLQELVEDDPGGKIQLQLPGDTKPKGYRVDGWMTGEPGKSSDRNAFYDHVAIRPTIGRWEIWRFLNTTTDVHPIHIHQSLFQPLGSTATAVPVVASYQPDTRDLFVAIIADAATPGRVYDAFERLGWKDTIRVNPGEMVSVAIRFDLPGKYVYHCHVLEHEDHMMMRPFVVMVLPMDDGMGGMGHTM